MKASRNTHTIVFSIFIGLFFMASRTLRGYFTRTLKSISVAKCPPTMKENSLHSKNILFFGSPRFCLSLSIWLFQLSWLTGGSGLLAFSLSHSRVGFSLVLYFSLRMLLGELSFTQQVLWIKMENRSGPCIRSVLPQTLAHQVNFCIGY